MGSSYGPPAPIRSNPAPALGGLPNVVAIVLIVGVVLGSFLAIDYYQATVEASQGGGGSGSGIPPGGPPTVGLGQIQLNVGGQGAGAFMQISYPTCNPTSGGDTVCFVPQAGGDCTFTGNPNPYELQVTVLDQNGNAMAGVSVSLAGGGVSISVTPSASLYTNAAGVVQFSQITGDVPANDPAGGYVSVNALYSSGSSTSTGSAQVQVEPPSSANC